MSDTKEATKEATLAFSLPPELWGCALSFVTDGPLQLLRLTSVCAAARRSLRYVTKLHVRQAAELDTRVLKHFASVTTLTVSARRDVSRAEAFAASRLPPDYQFQYSGAIGNEFDWIFDEDIARRLRVGWSQVALNPSATTISKHSLLVAFPSARAAHVSA